MVRTVHSIHFFILCWIELTGIMSVMAACLAVTSEASTAPFDWESVLGIGLDIDRFKFTASSARMACSISWSSVVGRWGTKSSLSLWWSPFLANSVTPDSSMLESVANFRTLYKYSSTPSLGCCCILRRSWLMEEDSLNRSKKAYLKFFTGSKNMNHSKEIPVK